MIEFSFNYAITLDYKLITVRTNIECVHLHLLKVPSLGTGLLDILVCRAVN